ncbi:MAG: hypothetical protein ACO3ZY_05650 [Phycisphaerales bacterium]
MPSPLSLARDRDDHVPPPPPAGESLADALRRTGARKPGRTGGFLGWIVSAGLHVLVAILAFLVTWTVVRWTETPREPVTASFESATFEPLASLADLEPTSEPLAEAAALEPAVEESLEQALAEAAAGPLDLIAGTGRERAAASAAVGMVAESATFAGLRATNARTIVYVVDASGSMIGSFRTVLDELARSLAGLVPAQSFAVIFFQRNQAIPVPPANRLVPVSRSAAQQAIEWARKNVIPSGRSNPVEALTRALALRPDCIFLLSSNITGAGQFEIDRADLLATLDRLNPIDSGSGRRRSQIQCIQFLDADPLDTMRTIAERHGGEGGYKFLDREELGLAAEEPPAESEQPR